jgi:hypothetical protein
MNKILCNIEEQIKQNNKKIQQEIKNIKKLLKNIQKLPPSLGISLDRKKETQVNNQILG